MHKMNSISEHSRQNIELYIVIELKDKFNNFDMEKIFPNECWKERFKTLKATSAELKSKIDLSKGKSKSSFDSWIDADYYLFGLNYPFFFHL